jgi:hypothetical protein
MDKIATTIAGIALLIIVGVTCYRVQEAFMAASEAIG